RKEWGGGFSRPLPGFFPFPFRLRYPLPGSPSQPQPRLLPVALASPVSALLPLPCLRLKTPPASGSGLSPQVAPTDGALLRAGLHLPAGKALLSLKVGQERLCKPGQRGSGQDVTAAWQERQPLGI
uniref:Uncharacterized protein n=1 Tax=Ailuropoda melanoleuca TaxID=9646 RepID=A0A7N5KH82_AILME